ncbi:MAG TPA: hypothetical protein VGB15_03935 [Longimicrobium sp.]|jgi:hypothetical protein
MITKLKLDVDALEVTSFDTDTAAQARGTVNAASGTDPLPATEFAPCPNDTEMTGPCCDHTLMLSCMQQTCDVVTC